MIMVGRSRLDQQLLDDHFRLLVFAFAEVMVPDAPCASAKYRAGQ
jgi:hypothetical protein